LFTSSLGTLLLCPMTTMSGRRSVIFSMTPSRHVVHSVYGRRTWGLWTSCAASGQAAFVHVTSRQDGTGAQPDPTRSRLNRTGDSTTQ
jgi:hypothetical protein